MPAKRGVREPAPPRVPEHLDGPPDPLGEGVSWTAVGAGAETSCSELVSDYEIVGSRLHGVRLTGAVFERGRFVDVVLDDCELSGTVLEETMLVRVRFQRCRMASLVANGMKGQDVAFADCKLDGANFRGSTMERCAFDDCQLVGTDFYGAAITGGAFRRCAMTDTEFSKAKCDGLDLRGSHFKSLKGASSLRRCVITSDQTAALGLALLTSMDVVVNDEPSGGV